MTGVKLSTNSFDSVYGVEIVGVRATLSMTIAITLATLTVSRFCSVTIKQHGIVRIALDLLGTLEKDPKGFRGALFVEG